MGEIYRFDRALLRDIPTPLGAEGSEDYAVLDIDPTVYQGFTAGAFAVVNVGRFRDSHMHAVDTSLGVILASLVWGEGDTIRVSSLCRDYPSHTSDKRHLNIIGCVDEIYPTGLHGTRWVVYNKTVHATEGQRQILYKSG